MIRKSLGFEISKTGVKTPALSLTRHYPNKCWLSIYTTVTAVLIFQCTSYLAAVTKCLTKATEDRKSFV